MTERLSMCNNILIRKEDVVRRIEAAKAEGGYTHPVTLVAVTKYHTVEETNAAICCGISNIAENHVQALVQKAPLLEPCTRHFIGHLQTNKVKQLLSVPGLGMIQSVDSVRLAAEIEKHASALGIDIDVLVQVNIAKEERKFGIDADQLRDVLADISDFSHVHVKGLMSIMPIQAKPDYYRRMRELFENTASVCPAGVQMQILSMGMSGDFETAVRYGSTMVRIGSYLFS